MEDDCSCCVYANFMHARVFLMVFVPHNIIPSVFFWEFFKTSKNDNKSMEC
jgi:hypothetical protein